MSTLICAEIGQNHEGDIELAQTLINEACAGGADIIKLQYWNVDNIYEKCDVRYKQARKRQLQWDHILILIKQIEDNKKIPCLSFFGAEKKQIDWIYQKSAADKLIIKYASSEINEFNKHLKGRYQEQDIILSSGYYRVSDSLKNIVTVLTCLPQYPTLDPAKALRDMVEYKESGYKAGFSDHSIGIESAQMAIMLEATHVEKHFTTPSQRQNSMFRDHIGSMTRSELEELIQWRDKFTLNKEDPDFIRKDSSGKRRLKIW